MEVSNRSIYGGICGDNRRMNTTNLIVEFLVVGLLALCWFLLGILCVTGQVAIDGVSRFFQWNAWAVLVIPLLFSFCYTLGVIVNRLSDYIIHRVDSKIRHSFFGGTETEALSRWRQAQLTVFEKSDRLKARLDFGRTILRVARSGMVNFSLIGALLPLAMWRLTLIQGYWSVTSSASGACLMLAVLSYYSWRRLAIVDYDITRAASYMLAVRTSSRETRWYHIESRMMTFDPSVQAIVFTISANGLRFLVLKRTVARGGFWQSVTGGIENGESVIDAAIREVEEETGCSPISIWPLRYIHEFGKSRKLPTGIKIRIRCLERSVAVQLPLNARICLNKEEHVEYRWVSKEEAIDVLKFDTNVAGIEELCQIIRSLALVEPSTDP